MTAVVALRPATPADSEFCYQLHKAAMGDYITAIWPASSLTCRKDAIDTRVPDALGFVW